MKSIGLLLFGLALTAQGATKLVLPTTMTSNSVQATLKNLLYQKLEKDGPQTEPYRAKLTGSYGQVTLEDENAKLVCFERSAGMLAVQTFGCEVISKNNESSNVSSLVLPYTMNSGSVQSTLKEILFEALKANEISGEHGGAALSGTYSNVTLADAKSKVNCQEHSAGMLAVQQFTCKFETK